MITQFNPMAIARTVAEVDVPLAYHLARVAQQRRMLGVQTLNVTFATGTVESSLEATFPTTLGEDFYVVDIRSTVQRPRAFAGSIFKAQSDQFNAQNSGIWTRLEVVGGVPGRRYVINDQFAPLEIVAPNASAPTGSLICGLNSVLEYSQSVRGTFVLKREYPEAELPLLVGVSFIGWSLGCQGVLTSISFDKARAYLAGLEEMRGVKLPATELEAAVRKNGGLARSLFPAPEPTDHDHLAPYLRHPDLRLRS